MKDEDKSHTGAEQGKGYSGDQPEDGVSSASDRKPHYLSPRYIRMAAVMIIGECVGGRLLTLRLPLTGKECSGGTGVGEADGRNTELQFIPKDAATTLLGEYIETWKRQVASGELTKLFEMYGGCGCQLLGATPTSDFCASKRRVLLAVLNDPVVHRAILICAESLHKVVERESPFILHRPHIERLCNTCLEFGELVVPTVQEDWITQMLRIYTKG